MNQIKKLPAFQNVAATGTAFVDLMPIVGGNTLEGIILTLGGTSLTKAMITAWRLVLNGKIVRKSTGPNTDSINKYYGITTAATQLLIDFMNRKAKTPLSFAAGAIDFSANSGIRQAILEVDISGATAPTLAGHAEISPIRVLPEEMRSRFVMRKQFSQTINAPSAAEHSLLITHVNPSSGGSVFEAIHLFAANITGIRIRRNGIDEFDLTKTQLEEIQKAAGRTPQSNHIVFDPVLDGIIPGRVWDTTSRSPNDPQRPGAGCNSAEVMATFSGSETFVVETQELIYLPDY